MPETMTDQPRAFELALDLDATPDEVWDALTRAEELVAGFRSTPASPRG